MQVEPENAVTPGPRIPTGIWGFDLPEDGGLRRGGVFVVLGGAEKTTFAVAGLLAALGIVDRA